MNDMLWWLLLAAVLWLIWDSLRAKEAARQAGKRACERAGVQFLDDSAVGCRFRLRRNRQGRMQLAREFCFEFSSDGEQRYQGRVSMLGQRVSEVYLQPYRAD